MPTPSIQNSSGNPTKNYTSAPLQACSLSLVGGTPLFFPTSEVNLNYEQAIGIHKHPNVVGAKIESLARGPIKFYVKAEFFNGVAAGSGEKWGTLFPNQYSAVLALLMDEANNNQTKIFVHPVFGKFNVKNIKASTKIDSTKRNGAVLDFELIEANVSPNDISSASSVSSGVQAANDFDQNAYAKKIQNILDD